MMVTILLGDGFEEMEAVIPYDMLTRAEIPVQFAGIGGELIRGSRGISIKADLELSDVCYEQMDMIVLPGGLGGVKSILDCRKALRLVKNAWEDGKYVAAICAAPTILAKLGISDGKNATVYPGMEGKMHHANMIENAKTVVDGKLITATAAGSAFEFAKALITALKDEQTAERVAKGIVL